MNAPADLSRTSLEDKYTLERGTVFLTGTQALIRLLMLQREVSGRLAEYGTPDGPTADTDLEEDDPYAED